MKRFQRWQNKVLFGTLIGYTAYNMLRVNLGMAMPSIREEFNLSHTEAGLIFSAFTMAYSMGRLFNGFFSDKNNARFFMTFGLVVCAALNLSFLGVNSYMAFMILWGLNGWFQTMGGPASSRMLTHWFPPEKMGTRWAIWSCSNPIGGGATFLITGALIPLMGWKMAFITPAVVALVLVPFLLLVLRDRPQDVFGEDWSEESLKGEELSEDEKEIEKAHWTTKEIFSQVLSNKNLWLICGASFSLYCVRTGFIQWCPDILASIRGFDIKSSGVMGFIFDMGGLAGGLIAGLLSDKLFKGRRGPVGFAYMSLLAIVIYYFWVTPAQAFWVDKMIMVAFGFFAFGPQVLVGVAAADFATKKAVGVGTGLVGCFGYLGSTFSGVGIGYIVDHLGGWQMGFLAFISIAIFGAGCFFLTMLNTRSQAHTSEMNTR